MSAAVDAPSARWRTGLRFVPWEAALAAVLLLFLGWRAVNEAPQPGLDPSWGAALHMAQHSTLTWGDDLVFTYGPLGWLRQSVYWYEDTGRLALGYLVATRLALFGLLWTLTRPLLGRFGAFILLLPIAWSIDDPVQVIGAAGALWFAAHGQVLSPRKQSLMVAGLAALASWELLGKVNVGILIAATTGAALVFVVPRRMALRLIATWIATFVGALIIFWLFAGQPLGALPSYLLHSAQIVSGYSNAMGIEDPALAWQYWAVGLLWLAGVVATIWFGTPTTWRDRLAVIAVWSLASFFVFKAGFVRHDVGHGSIPFVTLAPLALALPWRRTFLGRLGAVVLSLAAVWGFMAGNKLEVQTVVAPIEHQRLGRAQISGLYDWNRRRDQRLAGLTSVEAQDGLEDTTRRALTGVTVDSWPYETAVVWAYQLKWSPQPIFQGYQSNTADLDELNAEHLSSAQAPDRVLVGPNASIDSRIASFDTPAAARELLCRYVPMVQQQEHWMVVARGRDRCSAPRPLSSQSVAWGQIVKVPTPAKDTVVFAKIDGAGVQGTEKLRSTLLRSYERSIDLGPAGVHRAIPATIGSDLPLASGVDADYAGSFALAPDAPTIKIDRSDHPRGGQPLRVAFYEVKVASAATPGQSKR